MARLAALILAVFGLLPIANWIAGGHEAPWYDVRLRLWLIGGVVVSGVAWLVVRAAARWPGLWSTGAWQRIARRWHEGGRRGDGVIALVAGLLYATVARAVFAGRPLLTDEVIQLVQARIFAGGRLWLPAGAHPEFTSAMHLIDWAGKVYGQFPAGGPAMLALGSLIRAEWLVVPVAGAISVYCLARLLRLIESQAGVALAAVLLFAFAPFVVFLDGSMMNHGTTLMWLLVAALALAHVTGRTPGSGSTAGWAAVLGLALGVAATIRPTDGAAFALPAAGWLAWRAWRGGWPEWKALLWSGVGVAVPLALLFWVNTAQSGHPLEFGYLTMWGKSHELGFHPAPWGPDHTPARGLELVNLYLLRLQLYLFETPVPGLLFATAALALTRRLSAFDRYLLAGSALLLIAYFAYWHDGFYLGPRFVLPLAPWLALWTARLPAAIAARGGSDALQRFAVSSGVISLLAAAFVLLPIRVDQYRHGLPVMRLDADAAAEAAGAHDAIILVRESWGEQLYVRMWALGVSRVESYQLFSRLDACELDELLTRVESRGEGAPAFLPAARALAQSTHRLVRLRVVGDSGIHLAAGKTIAPRCLRRLRENQVGFTSFTPLLLAGRSGNRFVRDLHARDSLLFGAGTGRPVYLLLRDTTTTAPLRLLPVALDSAIAEWHADTAIHP
ncbi:MAG: hypothetical protein V4503_05630 [Gemmatimonadota bacterium]